MTPAADDQRLHALWSEFRSTHDPDLRNRLVLHYSPLVKYVVGRMRSTLPDSLDSDDLVSDGVIGLLDAIGRFEPGRGLSFQTFAVPRIRGAILDGLRALDILPRSVRAQVRQVRAAKVVLEHRLGRTPEDVEVAAEAGLTLRAMRALDVKVSIGDQSTLEGRDLSDELASSSGGAMEDREVNETLLRLVAELPERDQIIIALYYFEGLTLAEIGTVLGVTEGAISQAHTRATARLRPLLVATQPD